MKEPIWISEYIAIAIQQDLASEHNTLIGIRDRDLLSASLARPRHLFSYEEPSLFEIAAAYCYGLCKNHPFMDGNKRTAFAIMGTFLILNGYALEVEDMEVVRVIQSVASNEQTQQSLADWLTLNCVERNYECY